MSKKSHISLRARKTNVTFRPLLCFHLLLATQLLTKQKIQVEEERNWSEWVDSVLGYRSLPKELESVVEKETTPHDIKTRSRGTAQNRINCKWQYQNILQKKESKFTDIIPDALVPASPVIGKIVYHRIDTTGEVQQQQQRNSYQIKEKRKLMQFTGYQGKRTTKLYQIFESALKMAVNVIAQVFAISPPKFTRNGHASKPPNFNIYFRFPKKKRKHKHLRRRQKRKVQNLSCGSALRVTQVRSIWASNNLPRPWPK